MVVGTSEQRLVLARWSAPRSTTRRRRRHQHPPAHGCALNPSFAFGGPARPAPPRGAPLGIEPRRRQIPGLRHPRSLPARPRHRRGARPGQPPGAPNPRRAFLRGIHRFIRRARPFFRKPSLFMLFPCRWRDPSPSRPATGSSGPTWSPRRSARRSRARRSLKPRGAGAMPPILASASRFNAPAAAPPPAASSSSSRVLPRGAGAQYVDEASPRSRSIWVDRRENGPSPLPARLCPAMPSPSAHAVFLSATVPPLPSPFAANISRIDGLDGCCSSPPSRPGDGGRPIGLSRCALRQVQLLPPRRSPRPDRLGHCVFNGASLTAADPTAILNSPKIALGALQSGDPGSSRRRLLYIVAAPRSSLLVGVLLRAFRPLAPSAARSIAVRENEPGLAALSATNVWLYRFGAFPSSARANESAAIVRRAPYGPFYAGFGHPGAARRVDLRRKSC